MTNFILEDLKIPGAKLVRCRRHVDPRGAFTEIFNQGIKEALGMSEATQANLSESHAGVIRGLHIQRVKPQAKFVYCVKGKIYDVGVDLRHGSPTFGEHVAVELSEPNVGVFWPKGIAHGLLAMEDSIVVYQCDGAYHPEYDGGIYFGDPRLGIKWPYPDDPEVVSAKDLTLPTLEEWLSTQ